MNRTSTIEGIEVCGSIGADFFQILTIDSPTWSATLQGQIDLRGAVNGTIDFIHPKSKYA